MANYTKLSYKEDGHWWTCGCNGSKKEKAILPANTVPLMINHQGYLTGPVTGWRYYVARNFISVDIHKDDAEAFKLDKKLTIIDVKPPYKGYWARSARQE